mgnify:CR=1 FL=1
MNGKSICNICMENTTELNLPCEHCKHLEWYICDGCIIKMQTYEDISKKCPLCRRESVQLVELYEIINEKDRISDIYLEEIVFENENSFENRLENNNTNYCYKYIQNVCILIVSIVTYITMRQVCILFFNRNDCEMCTSLSTSTGTSFLLFLYIKVFRCLKKKISFVLEQICLFVFCNSIFTLIFTLLFIGNMCNINNIFLLYWGIFILIYFSCCFFIYHKK